MKLGTTAFETAAIGHFICITPLTRVFQDMQRSLRLKLDKYQNIAIALSFDSVSVLSILFLTILYKGG